MHKPLRLQPTKFSERKIREARIKRELPQQMIAKTIRLTAMESKKIIQTLNQWA